MRIDSGRATPSRFDLPVQPSGNLTQNQTPELSLDPAGEEIGALPPAPAPNDPGNFRPLAQDAARRLDEHFRAAPALNKAFNATLEYVIHHMDRMYDPGSIISREAFCDGLKYIRDVLKNSQDAAMIARADHEREESARRELAAYLMGIFRDNFFAARRFIDSHLDDGMKIDGGGLQSGLGGGGQQGRNRDQRDLNQEIPAGTILKK